ncbi:MAG: hypothetical protein E6G02_14790 [Actinobacteria bacterium]|nr:MAG: hypothetical protein E6G02_14790 [Actinomycetota bacterium]
MNATSNHSFVYNRFWTGTRPSEAIALRCGDVDWSNRRIRIQRSRVLGEDGRPKTGPEQAGRHRSRGPRGRPARAHTAPAGTRRLRLHDARRHPDR